VAVTSSEHADRLIDRMLELERSGVPYAQFMASLPYDDLVVLSYELQRRCTVGEELKCRPVTSGAEGSDA
jgi:hypothetical protein